MYSIQNDRNDFVLMNQIDQDNYFYNMMNSHYNRDTEKLILSKNVENLQDSKRISFAVSRSELKDRLDMYMNTHIDAKHALTPPPPFIYL
jgi:hypothetical protein